jgi:uncharacterized protein (TIGR02996 family)
VVAGEDVAGHAKAGDVADVALPGVHRGRRGGQGEAAVSEHDAFLTALAEDEDDTTTRLVYADWLDDHGAHEEADRQRRWTPAKAWLVRFCQENNPAPGDDSEECVIDYETLLDLGREAVGRADRLRFGFSCGNNMTMHEALWASSREFWTNWSIVTGIPLPPDVESRSYFRCAC